MKKRLFTSLFILTVIGVFAGIVFHVKWLGYHCKPLIMISIGGYFLLNTSRLDKNVVSIFSRNPRFWNFLKMN